VAKYLLAYHGGGMPETEEEQAKVMAAWGEWYGKLGAAVVDPGNPIGLARTVAKDGSMTDGGGANPVSGYSIIDVSDIDAATDAARGCPVLQSGGSVEVAETFNVM